MKNDDTIVETKYAHIYELLGEEHYDTWVAFSADGTRVVAYDDDLRKLDHKVAGEDVIYLRTLPKDVVFIPTILS